MSSTWNGATVAFAVGAMLLVGCASQPPAELVEARQSYDVAAADPTVVENAATALQEAEESLTKAESAFEDDADPAEVSHLASVAAKRVEIAAAAARARAAAQELERLEARRAGEPEEAPASEVAAEDSATEATPPAPESADDRDAAETDAAESEASDTEVAPALARIEERLRSLEARLTAEPTPADDPADAEDAGAGMAEAQTETDPEGAAERRARELAASNARATRLALEMQATIDAAERRLGELEAANELAEQERRERKHARVRESEAPPPAPPAVTVVEVPAPRAEPDERTTEVTDAKRALERQIARERAERRALERQETEEAHELRLQQELALSEVRSTRRTLEAETEPAPQPRRTAAADPWVAPPPRDDTESYAERRARSLEEENERLRAANEALLEAVEASGESEPAPPRERERVVERAPREIVVVEEEDDDEVSSRRAAELESALSSERERAAALEASQQETLASVSAAREDAERAKERAARLERERAELQEWNAKLTTEGIVLTLSELFAANQSEPMPEEQESLTRLAAMLKKRPDRSILIEGHTDSTGAEEYNLGLSRLRAESVLRYLESAGVPADQMEASGAGENEPIAPNDSAWGRERNRRVEVMIFDPPGERTAASPADDAAL